MFSLALAVMWYHIHLYAVNASPALHACEWLDKIMSGFHKKYKWFWITLNFFKYFKIYYLFQNKTCKQHLPLVLISRQSLTQFTLVNDESINNNDLYQTLDRKPGALMRHDVAAILWLTLIAFHSKMSKNKLLVQQQNWRQSHCLEFLELPVYFQSTFLYCCFVAFVSLHSFWLLWLSYILWI